MAGLQSQKYRPEQSEPLPFRRPWIDDPAAFFDGDDLVCLHVGEALRFLRSRPLHLYYIDRLSASQSKVQTKVTLGHDAAAAVNLVHLSVFACDHSHPSSDRCAVAVRAYQLDLDPVLRVSAVVAQQGRQ